MPCLLTGVQDWPTVPRWQLSEKTRIERFQEVSGSSLSVSLLDKHGLCVKHSDHNAYLSLYGFFCY